MRFGRVVLLAGLVVFSLARSTAWAADPWVPPSDAALALRDPDRFAWQMFVALTWPADVGSRLAATDRPYGDPGPAMFETWALSDQVFLTRGAQPPVWSDIPWSGIRTLSARPVPRQVALFRQVDPVAAGSKSHQQEEIRFNRSAYDYMRDNGLYAIEGQQAFYYDHRPVSFPADAISVQAIWRPISEEDKARYQWTVMKDAKSGRQFTYGLTALHIESRVLPNGFWATFEHIDNPFRSGLHDEGWLTASRDSVACPAGYLDCNKIPTGFGLEGTRWENYRLRGTQVDYVDNVGNPVILANSELETGFQQSASCMSCHARATIGPSMNDAARFPYSPANKEHPSAPPEPMRLPVFNTLPSGQVVSFNGAPAAGSYLLPGQAPGGTQAYLPLDFVWALIEADSTAQPDAPPPKQK
jgi:hypothetical protein